MGNHGAQRTSLSTVKAMWSTQRPQTCTEPVTNYYIITLQTKPMKRGNTDCQQFRSSGDQATVEVYIVKVIFFDAMIGSKSYTICTKHVKNIFPRD